jgi:hypothetical protein
MPAIRSGESCAGEPWSTAETFTEPALARLGSVQPIRHASTASHAESPVAITALKSKRIRESLYPLPAQHNCFGDRVSAPPSQRAANPSGEVRPTAFRLWGWRISLRIPQRVRGKRSSPTSALGLRVQPLAGQNTAPIYCALDGLQLRTLAGGLRPPTSESCGTP